MDGVCQGFPSPTVDSQSDAAYDSAYRILIVNSANCRSTHAIESQQGILSAFTGAHPSQPGFVMTSEDIHALRRDCGIANKLWGQLWSALHLVTLREKGDDALHALWRKVLASHQSAKYRDGMRKLGIRDDEPPAVAAAKYHYLTNVMGGLGMEYVEESPKKVWIRYVAPMWTYPGVSMLAVPTTIRRTSFSSWHPFNGKLMGCPRLGWVATKFITEGYPCDEGYFIEYDHDLKPGEEMRYEVCRHTPECDPSKLPKFDEELWPEARRLKAGRNWSGGYVRSTIETLQLMYGENATNYLVAEAMRGLAIQFAHELRRDVGIEGNDVASLAATLAAASHAFGQTFESVALSPSHHRLVIESFKPFDDDAPEALRAAFFEFQVMAVRMWNGRVSITRRAEDVGGDRAREVWDLEDQGRWLW